MRILLLEDETTLRENLTDRLRSEGFVVDAVGDGVEGAYFAVEYPLDLAIVDLGLPGKSGLDVVKELRRADKRFPVLILTARSLAGQGRSPGFGRRRLPDQAVSHRGTDRQGACLAEARRRSCHFRARVRAACDQPFFAQGQSW